MSSTLVVPLVLLGLWTAALGTPAPVDATGPTIAGCPAFPAAHPFNQPVTRASVDPRSRRYIATMSRDRDRLWTGANAGRWSDAGFTVHTVPRTTPPVPITIDRYANGAIDPTAMPIPPAPTIQQAPDRHLLIVQQGSCRLYESWETRPPAPEDAGGPWRVGSAASWDLRSNEGLPPGATSADAAGLPITPLLLRADEVATGTVGHALRLTSPTVQDGWVAPAVHPGSYDGADKLDFPPMGARLRLRAGVRPSSFSGQARVIVRTLQTYGAILSDQTEPQWAWELSGTNDPRWDDRELAQLRTIRASDFEVVRHGPIGRFEDLR